MHFRMPARFIGISGVYDVAQHYSYEEQRGVHEISSMKRAMGGLQHFGALSPSVIIGAAIHTVGSAADPAPAAGRKQPDENNCSTSGILSSDAAALHGSRIAAKVGFGRGAGPHQALGYDLQSLRNSSSWFDFPLEAAAHLPPSVLMSSCSDMTVPW